MTLHIRNASAFLTRLASVRGSKRPQRQTSCWRGDSNRATARQSHSEEKPRRADRESLRAVRGALPETSTDKRPGWEQVLDRLVIHPYNRAKLCFDVVVMISVLVTAFVLPVDVAFGSKLAQELETFVDVVFISDVCLQFFSGYVKIGYPILSVRAIATKYVKGWFFIDVLASFPFEVFDSSLKTLQLIKVVRLLRIRRMLRKWWQLATSNFIKVGSTLAAWLLIAHWFACTFYAIGVLSHCAWNWSEESWVFVYWPKFTCDCADLSRAEGSVGNCPAENQVLLSTRYIRSLYWALASMSSLGYGTAPVAINDAEFGFTILCQVSGACVYAAIFGNIAQLIHKLDASGLRYQAQLDKINEFIRFHDLPPVMCNKLHAYNNFLFAVTRGFDVSAVSSALPVSIQKELNFSLHAHLVRNVSLFDTFDISLIKGLVRMLRPQVLLARDVLFHAFETGTTMYFIEKGAVEMTSPDGKITYATLGEGSYFGELSMLTSQEASCTAASW